MTWHATSETATQAEMNLAEGPCPFEPPCPCNGIEGEPADRHECACWHHNIRELFREWQALRDEVLPAPRLRSTTWEPDSATAWGTGS